MAAFCLCNGHPVERALLVTVGMGAQVVVLAPPWPRLASLLPGPGGLLQGTGHFVLQGQSRSGAEKPRALSALATPVPAPRPPGHFAHSKAVLEAAAHLSLFNARPSRHRCASAKGCSLDQSASVGLTIPSPWALTPGQEPPMNHASVPVAAARRGGRPG